MLKLTHTIPFELTTLYPRPALTHQTTLRLQSDTNFLHYNTNFTQVAI